jgi:hypothetical protein
MAFSEIFPDYPEPGLGSVPVVMTQVTDRTLWVRYDITRTEEENSSPARSLNGVKDGL